jgi:two-component system invasion response regulator UvrY
MLKILIVDDHAVVRQGLKQILAEKHEDAKIGEAGTGEDAVQMVKETTWDVVVLDISLPDVSGLDVLKFMRDIRPNLPIIVLTMHAEEQYAVRALRAGAAGYLTKETAPDQLVAAIRRVAEGGKYISEKLAEKLAYDLGPDAKGAPHEALSDREYQVMCMIASGKATKEIALELSLSEKTISTHRSRILDKMNMKSNAELIRYAIENKLVQ